MGTLKKDSQLRIDLVPCWNKAFLQFSNQFPGKFVSHFTLTGTSISAPRFQEDFFFIVDVKNSDFVNLENYVGGEDIQEKVRKYLHYGPKSTVRHIAFSPKQEGYYKNPAMWWYQTPDGLYHPWPDTTMPRISRIAAQVTFLSKYNLLLPRDSGTVKFDWVCNEKDFGPAWLVGSSIYATPSAIKEFVLSKKRMP